MVLRRVLFEPHPELILLLACTGRASEPPEPPPKTIYTLASASDGVETWGADDGSTVSFHAAKNRLDGQWAKRGWADWSDTLEICLGKPLDLPPGADPGGFRKLTWDGKQGHWTLELTGMNRCAMSGRIHLAAKRDVVDVGELVVDGTPWPDGGGEVAVQLLRLELRERIVDAWPGLPPEEQMSSWRSLERDPDSADTLRELEERYGPFSFSSSAAPNSNVRP